MSDGPWKTSDLIVNDQPVKLNARARAILLMKSSGLTFEEIARRMKITAKRAKHVYEKSVKKIDRATTK